ncbi:hypothetical protein [Yersinia kristensenii]|uniref:hypothetical protein n=1 Tax=Yersinia kristensenii TaxID=28152 RepID=UPI0001A5444A|nr:hypothetical protein [Yersinia kristensenii]EEP89544.1 hypothetical protein ykris0001_38300 [Yersinia kristensenii ATCC 33638]PEH52032.1 hypothetical protein CRM81_00880 [Yersinia kristensenii]SUP69818.1 Uncharacterised protein [Yersinia kristensenii]
MNFSFVIDEVHLSSIFLNAQENIEKIKWYSNLCSHLPDKHVDVFITRNLLSKKYNGVDNVELFYPQAGIARDEAMKFVLYQNRKFKKYDKNDCIVNNEDLSAYEDFHCFLLKHKYVSVITSEVYGESDWWDDTAMNIFNKSLNSIVCIRDIIVKINSISDDDFQLITSVIFPKLYFNWTNKIKLDNFKLKDSPIKWVINSLSYLNDHALNDYISDPSTCMIEAQKRGFNISPESTKTRKAKRMMQERNIIIANKTVCCEWHFKYSAHDGGRIHFHFGNDVDKEVKGATNGLPIVGIFAHHLSIK